MFNSPSRFWNFHVPIPYLAAEIKINSMSSCSQIVVKFHNAFYSIFNHFLVLSAELLEIFLICNECLSPIGFSHQPQCMNATSKPSIWRKTKYDDKFITFGMKFSFYDIVSSEYRHNIIRKAIESACWEQRQQQQQQQQYEHASSSHKESQQFISKNWPSRWLRDDSDKLRDDKKRGTNSRIRSPYPPTSSSSPDNSIFQPLPLFLLNQWTPLTDDIELLTTNNFISNPNCALRQHDTVNLLEGLPSTSNQSNKNWDTRSFCMTTGD